MFKSLLVTRFQMLFSAMFRGSKTKKQRGIGFRILVGFLVLYILFALGGLFFTLFYSLSGPLCDAGLSWLYFSLMGIVVAALCFVGSVFAAQTQLFEARDNELLLSMPIPPRMILLSRMLMLLLLNYLFEALVAIPAGIAYALTQPFSAAGLICFVAVALLLPLLVLAITCLFGWLVALISSRLPYKNFITIVLFLLFFVAYFMVMTNLQTYIGRLVENGAAIAEAIRRAVFPAYHLGVAIADGNPISLLLFALCAVLPFLLVYALLSANFIRLVTTRRGARKMKYREKALKVSGVRMALIQKECRHFFASPMYMLNGATGLILMVVLVVLCIVNREALDSLAAQLPFLKGQLPLLACAGLCACASMNIISAPSISLEGKNLWIVRSLPIDSGEILLSKADAHLLICLPVTLACAVVCGIFFSASVLQWILLLVLPVIVTAFFALFGVTVNLHFPKFDWVSETVAVKQSASTMISLFGAMAIIIAPIVLYGMVFSAWLDVDLYLFLCGAAFLVLALVLRGYLKTGGQKVLERL